MNATANTDRAARFVREALADPGQVDDVALKAPPAGPRADLPEHAHGDFFHLDTGHLDTY